MATTISIPLAKNTIEWNRTFPTYFLIYLFFDSFRNFHPYFNFILNNVKPTFEMVLNLLTNKRIEIFISLLLILNPNMKTLVRVELIYELFAYKIVVFATEEPNKEIQNIIISFEMMKQPKIILNRETLDIQLIPLLNIKLLQNTFTFHLLIHHLNTILLNFT